MNAIGHHLMHNNAKLKVLYVTTERFMNELINHLQYGKSWNSVKNTGRLIFS